MAFELNRLRISYYNILAYFLEHAGKEKPVIDCLQKWGLELGIAELELKRLCLSPGLISYQRPQKVTDKLQQVYDLVFMIYLDGEVEDVELALASRYALATGLETHVVNNLLKALIAAPEEGSDEMQLRADISQHPELYV
jgi:hypothetical protein